jgi:hypothetical protein
MPIYLHKQAEGAVSCEYWYAAFICVNKKARLRDDEAITAYASFRMHTRNMYGTDDLIRRIRSVFHRLLRAH